MDTRAAVISCLRDVYGRLPGADVSEDLAAALSGEFLRLYGQDHRHYHNLTHVVECLNEFGECFDQCKDPLAVEIAILYHDVVYEPGFDDNELLSANKCRFDCARMHVDESFGQSVADLIMATRHTNTLTEDAALVADIDLSILGKPWERFLEYENGIRKEYISVPDKDYVSGRHMVMDGFLRRVRIYHTDLFKDRYEKQARANIARSLMRLRTHA